MLARQATNPVSFNRSTRRDYRDGRTSMRAGVVVPISYFPVFRGDSVSGSFQAQFDLAEMPKPLMNGVNVHVQAWFVPKPAYPQFPGYDDFMYSYQGENIKHMGSGGGLVTRAPVPIFLSASGADLTAYAGSEFLKKMGIHLGDTARGHNLDLIDAYNLIWNFRAASHSSKITRRDYALENMTNALAFARAFWPTSKFQHVVPDYEQALVMGALDLDVLAGQIPVSGLGVRTASWGSPTAMNDVRETGQSSSVTYTGLVNRFLDGSVGTTNAEFAMKMAAGYPQVFAEMGGQTVQTTLADIDKARTTQAFAKLRAAYAGTDHTGFDRDDAIVAELMQGLSVPEQMFKRPWLLDSSRVPFGFAERFASDAANLDQSVSQGQASVNLSLNIPAQDAGGVVLITAEILPELMHERQGDAYLHVDDVSELPNALRDIQRPEPVDLVNKWRVDQAHTTPDGLYGYEPMNAKWDRNFTCLGGDFYQSNPLAPVDEARANLWLANVVDPEFTDDHWLAPTNFPHTVFSDTLADASEVTFMHNVSIRGLTQIGDPLYEDNNEYTDTAAEGA